MQVRLILCYDVMTQNQPKLLNQIGIFVLRGDFSPVYISCHPQLQPRNSCKMSIPAVQNSSSKEIFYVTLYSHPGTHYFQPRKILIEAPCSHIISMPQSKSPIHYSKFPVWHVGHSISTDPRKIDFVTQCLRFCRNLVYRENFSC